MPGDPAVQAYEKRSCRFIVVARKTARLVEQLKAADWKPSPRTDADGQCEFFYQPEDWNTPYRFLALRYEKKPEAHGADEPEQYRLLGRLRAIASGASGFAPVIATALRC